MAFTFNGIPVGGGFKARRAGFGIGSFIFLCVFGLLFIGVSFLFIGDDLKSINWKSTDGTITNVTQSTDSDGDVMYRPTASYTVGGKTYEATPAYSSSQHYTVGDSQTVHYDPANPAEGVIRTNGVGFFVYLFPIVGLLVIVFGTFGFIRDRKRSAQIAALKQNGVKIQGVITDVSSGGSSNNRSSMIMVSATGPDGQVHHYPSDKISGMGIVGLAEYQTKPIAIDVYIDPTRPETYYVDLDDIPDITPERIASLLQNVAKQPQVSPPAATPPIIDKKL